MTSSCSINNAFDMDLEGGITASFPPPSPNNLSSASSDDASIGNNNHDRTTTNDQPGAVLDITTDNATAPTPLSATRDGPKLVDDASGLPLLLGMVEATSLDDALLGHSTEAGASSSVGPAPPSSLEAIDNANTKLVHELSPPTPLDPPSLLEEDVDEDEKKKSSMEASFEQNTKTNLVNHLSPPTPFNPSAIEDHADSKKKATMPLDSKSIIVPTREEIEEEDEFGTSRGSETREEDGGLPSNNNDRLVEETPHPFSTSPVGTGLHYFEEEMTNVDTYLDVEEGVNERNANQSNNQDEESAGPVFEHDQSTLVIPEAFLVEERSEDGIIVQGHAEPLLPFWKQRRPRLLLGGFIFFMVILAVSLGVPLSLKASPTPAATIVVVGSNAPSENPTYEPSYYPSTSDSPSFSLKPTAGPSTEPTPTPSSSPSECVNQLLSNTNKIDLEIIGLQNFKMAFDGIDLVIVATLGNPGDPVFVMFYELRNDQWQRTSNVIQITDVADRYSVAISGNTAFVGVPSANDWAGVLITFEKSQLGYWEKVEDPFIHSANVTNGRTGWHVDVERDLACVVSHDKISLYRKEEKKWIQFEAIDSVLGSCSIIEDEIATYSPNNSSNSLRLFKIDSDLDSVVPVQDPIPAGTTWSMGHDYIVYWDSKKNNAVIYHREEKNQPYMIFQQFNISGQVMNSVALRNDILVIGGEDSTYIFSEQHGKWEEAIKLNQGYQEYQISGRNLLGTKGNDVYFINIQPCSQLMPTQLPSFFPSSSPSMSPTSTSEPSSSSSPSMIPSISFVPSSSSFPTETCSWIQIAITYDYGADTTLWQIQRVVGNGGENELVVSHQALEGDTSYIESFCLQEAEYIFTISDIHFGIFFFGNYNVTSNGLLIGKGGGFGISESTTFSIPFVSQHPSMSPSPSPLS